MVPERTGCIDAGTYTLRVDRSKCRRIRILEHGLRRIYKRGIHGIGNGCVDCANPMGHDIVVSQPVAVGNDRVLTREHDESTAVGAAKDAVDLREVAAHVERHRIAD